MDDQAAVRYHARVYVSAPWQLEFEQWWKGKFPREGTSEHLFQSEIGVGLPYRFQVDFYENVFVKGGSFRASGQSIRSSLGLCGLGQNPPQPHVLWEVLVNFELTL